jgi:hypothetical protein
MMVKHGTFLVPTVYLGDYYEQNKELRAQDKNDEYIKHGRADFLAAIARAHKAGVKVVVGLDLGSYNIDPKVYAREFAVFVEAGLSPMARSSRARAWPPSCCAGTIVSARSSVASSLTSSRCRAIR